MLGGMPMMELDYNMLDVVIQLGESPIDDCSDNDDNVKLQSHRSNNVTTDEEGSCKERSEQGPPST
jgi:hypothetical protein